MRQAVGRVKHFLRTSFEKARVWGFRVSPSGVRYSFLGSSFTREHSAVAQGISAHYKFSRLGKEQFALRRRIHMLEKGLSMRPRRITFAVGYLPEALDKLAGCLRAGVLSEETKAWARDVLTEYFGATQESPSTVIARERERFEKMELSSTLSSYVGPSRAGSLEPAVDLQAMTRLAFERVSVRWFEKRPVPRDVVDGALRIAQEAPTACNRVPYRFIILDTPEEAVEVASIAGGTAGYSHNIPALAVIVGDLSAYSEERDRHLIYIDGGLAAMGFLYGLEAQGVSSCCINWPDVKKREVRMAKALNLRPFERVVMLVAFGYADADGLVPGSPKLGIQDLRTYV